MTTCYIAFHERRGIYLGIYEGYAMFSNTDFAFSSKSIRFGSQLEIRDFFYDHFPSIAAEISGIPITTKALVGYYVNLVDILKSGHTKHTQSMLYNLPVASYTIH